MYIPAEDGSFISEKHARISELIRDYDPNLDVRWIPPAKRDEGDLAFCIVERTRDGKEVIAFYCEDLDERILARIYAGDITKNDVQANLDNNNAAARAYAKKVADDVREEKMDFARTVINSPLHTFRHNGRKYQ